jgi:hypothetical protein
VEVTASRTSGNSENWGNVDVRRSYGGRDAVLLLQSLQAASRSAGHVVVLKVLAQQVSRCVRPYTVSRSLCLAQLSRPVPQTQIT